MEGGWTWKEQEGTEGCRDQDRGRAPTAEAKEGGGSRITDRETKGHWGEGICRAPPTYLSGGGGSDWGRGAEGRGTGRQGARDG